jgi:hypothetical protein
MSKLIPESFDGRDGDPLRAGKVNPKFSEDLKDDEMDSLNVNVMSSAGGTNEYSFQEEDEEIKTAAKQRKAEEETKAEFNIRFTMSGPSQPYIPEVKKKEPEYPKNSKLVP